mmetsp:Transcript_80748/g.168438  ORF Transcript_80748/g.168438 Transcript_80748/m.168438 type:complete len:275 (+) Transcript_80748:957-1781(+)
MAPEGKFDDVVLGLLHQSFVRLKLELSLHLVLGIFLLHTLLLQGLDGILLLLVLTVHFSALLLVHLLEGCVVSTIVDELFVLEVQDVGTDAVKEIGVVTNNDDCVRVHFGEVVIQPEHSVQIQVIRRFIQHQQLGLQEESLRQTDTHSPTSGELNHRSIHGETVLVGCLVREAKTTEDLSHLGLGSVGARSCEVDGDLLELISGLLQLIHGDILALVGHLFELFELRQEGLFFHEEVGRLGVGGNDLVNSRSIGCLSLLLHEDDIPVLGNGHVP